MMDEQSHVKLLESGLRRWWIVLIALVVTTGLTLVWVSSKPSVYKSSGTYVIQARSEAGDDSVRALEALIRSAQINATYALIARSDAVRNPAIARLPEIPQGARPNVNAEAMTGTNALTISATARDAETAQALAVAAGVETIAYVEALDEPYDLVLLDSPERPSGPVNTRTTLTVGLGAVLGLLLGCAIAAMLDRIEALQLTSRRRSLARVDREDDASERAAAMEAGAEPTMELSARIDPEPAREIPAVIEPARALSAGVDEELGFVFEAASDPDVHREIAEASDGGGIYSVGVLRIAQPNGSGSGGGNGNGGGGHVVAATAATHSARFAGLLHDHSLANGRTLSHVRDGLFATVLPDVGAVDAGKLLGEWVAGVDDLEAEDERGSIEIWIAIVEYSSTNGSAVATSSITTETPNQTNEKRSKDGPRSWGTAAPLR